jgi:hypothetical protein
MAATVLGLTLTFGTGTTISGLILQTSGYREAVNIAEVADEDGDFVAAALYGRKVTGTLEAIDNGYTALIGTLILVSGAPTGNFYITEKSQTRSNTGFMRRTIGVTAWGGI